MAALPFGELEPRGAPPGSEHKWTVTLSVMLVTVMQLLDTSITNVALPTCRGYSPPASMRCRGIWLGATETPPQTRISNLNSGDLFAGKWLRAHDLNQRCRHTPALGVGD
jgi:hypothetical protein